MMPFALMFSQEPGGGIIELFGLTDYVVSFSAFVATVLLATSFINSYFLKWSGSKKQYLSWALALMIGFLAFFLQLGIFASPWYHVLIYSFGFGLGANGFFDWELIQAILKALKLEPNK